MKQKGPRSSAREGRCCTKLSTRCSMLFIGLADMPRAPDIARVLRFVAVWLLAVCVCFGPGRFGASVARAVSPGCDTASPCAAASHGASASHSALRAAHAELAAKDACAEKQEVGAQYRSSDPCDGDCAESCPTCACRLGAAMAV